MVPSEDSIDLLTNGFTMCKAHLFLRDFMKHNKLDYLYDLIKPLKYFFSYHDFAVGSKSKTTYA